MKLKNCIPTSGKISWLKQIHLMYRTAFHYYFIVWHDISSLWFCNSVWQLKQYLCTNSNNLLMIFGMFQVYFHIFCNSFYLHNIIFPTKQSFPLILAWITQKCYGCDFVILVKKNLYFFFQFYFYFARKHFVVYLKISNFHSYIPFAYNKPSEYFTL